MISDEDKEKVADGIEILLSVQKKFQDEHGFDFWKLEPEKRREMFIRALFAAISELAEAGDEVNKWWKKGSKEPESLDSKRDKILEEMIDALHFFLAAALILKADGRDIAESYLKKMGVNFDRQKKKEHGYI